MVSLSTNKVILRNFEGVITAYKEPDSYEETFCNRECDECDLQLELDGAEVCLPIGIEKLLSDSDQAISLTPNDNERMERRTDND